jgi:hypothetical protein
MAGDTLLALLQAIALRAPSLVVGVVGLYFAISRFGSHPRASKLAIVGFSCLLATVVGFLALQAWVMYSPVIRAEPGRASELFSYWNIVAYPVNLMALVGMGAAVFADRRPTSSAA